jgi:rod shape-determining protein MreC
MQRLFLFLYYYRAFLIFLFLEILCLWLIVQNNSYQGARFFNSSNSLVGGVMETSGSISDYFALGEVNESLAEENARLRVELSQIEQSLTRVDMSRLRDLEFLNKYEFISAQVINNSTARATNYITINRGSQDGVEPEMAVIDDQGVVGKVKAVSKRFAVIISMLHLDVQMSSKLKRTGDLCTTQWDGRNSDMSKLKFLPRHVTPMVGDTVVTSGYNAVFPADVPIGIISEVNLEENSLWYDITLDLSADMNALSYVYLIKNKLKTEQDSLEVVTGAQIINE